MLVYVRRGVLAGHRFWWLLEEVQPQFEILNDAGIVVYQTANFAAPRLSPVAKSDKVAVTGISPDESWYRIRTRRGVGWVPALILDEGFVRFIGDMNDVPTVLPPALDQEEVDPTAPETPTQEPNNNNNNGNGNQPQQPATPIPEQPTNVPAATDIPATEVPPATDIPAPTVEAPPIPTEEPTASSGTE
jgi:hypothetical protein